jgi:hypothetical protein
MHAVSKMQELGSCCVHAICARHVLCRGTAVWELHIAALRSAALCGRALVAVQRPLWRRRHIAQRRMRGAGRRRAQCNGLFWLGAAAGAGAVQHCALRELRMAGDGPNLLGSFPD